MLVVLVMMMMVVVVVAAAALAVVSVVLVISHSTSVHRRLRDNLNHQQRFNHSKEKRALPATSTRRRQTAKQQQMNTNPVYAKQSAICGGNTARPVGKP